MKKSLLAAAVLIAAAAAIPADRSEAFHFGLRSSQPADGASVTTPEELVLTFTQIPQESSVRIRLIDPSEELVEIGEPWYDEEDRRIIHVTVDQMLAASEYRVVWRGIGDDGHVVTGDFTFSVTAER